MSQPEQINPRMLSWARDTAGLSAEEAANKLGLKNTAKVRAVDKLRALEAGDRAPSHIQLVRVAAAYRRPLIAFYLPQPRRRGDRGENFRTMTGAGSARDDGILDALLRDVRARQQMLKEVLQDYHPGTRASSSAAAVAFLFYAPTPPLPRPRDGAVLALSAGRDPRAFRPPHHAPLRRRCGATATSSASLHRRPPARHVEPTGAYLYHLPQSGLP
jgi:transcriptional regulator with XRE-family HTH domain